MMLLMAVVPDFEVRERTENVRRTSILATILLRCCALCVFGMGVFGVTWFVDRSTWQIFWIFICAIGAAAMFVAVLYCRLREQPDVVQLPAELRMLVCDFLRNNPTSTCLLRISRENDVYDLVFACQGKYFRVLIRKKQLE